MNIILFNFKNINYLKYLKKIKCKIMKKIIIKDWGGGRGTHLPLVCSAPPLAINYYSEYNIFTAYPELLLSSFTTNLLWMSEKKKLKLLL